MTPPLIRKNERPLGDRLPRIRYRIRRGGKKRTYTIEKTLNSLEHGSHFQQLDMVLGKGRRVLINRTELLVQFFKTGL